MDDLEPWDEDYQATAPDEDMKPLQQLQRYQHAVRRIFPFLDAYETTVLIQIVDRITGWRKHEACFSAQSLYAGDRMYGGVSRAMDRSRMMKALRTLEDRGVIRRRGTKHGTGARVYWVNFDVDLAHLEQTAKPKSKSANRPKRPRRAVSSEDQPVPDLHRLVSPEDREVSEEDALEAYTENYIGERIKENSSLRSAPSAQTTRTTASETQDDHDGRTAQAQSSLRMGVNPPPRRRPKS